MNRTEMLLTILAEECGEVAQRATKILRFGATEMRSDETINNTKKLEVEFNDLLAMVEMLRNEGIVIYQNTVLQQAKIDKVEHYLKYSEKIGTLTNNESLA